ncbi:M13 family metallopeptidase [Sphingobacterium sp. SRCM116780]|uniref:M13 family metallopeptidase n=1 Tax=Sphingobacterium sp. SRCM116780 TaxID=2907623 RepID=UPI001F2B5357|nr:M13 family metallopeptidase [Sphingobacterium sp. SRCM116780]UIR56876.1 M13 family metallopeptidase [Sphingobacterium sp. SRCM116780]
MVNKKLWSLLPLAALAFGCQSNTSSDQKQAERTVFFDVSGMDTTVNPGDNFFMYANGKWIKNTVIPASESGWGSFYILNDENLQKLHGILEKAAKSNSSKGSDQQKVGDFYTSGMDTVTIEKLGIKPIEEKLKKIDGLKSIEELIAYSADGFKEGDGDLFSFYIAADDRISNKNAATFVQGGLNLPEASYYLDQDDKAKKIREVYTNYLTKLFTLAGNQTTAKAAAESVLKLETAIAKSHLSPVELRDPIKNYNKVAVTAFQQQTPNLKWNDILNRLAIKTDTLLVQQPKFYVALNNLLKSESLDTWKLKLKADVLNSSATALTKDFRDASFELYGKTLNGQKEQKERWKLMVTTVDGSLGEVLGKLFTDEYFKPEAKKRMIELVNNLELAYRERIEKLDWMTPETKKKAIEKLEAFTKKIGYPDKWKDYSDVEINKDTYYANLQSASRHAYQEMINKMGKPVDKAEWLMTTPTVNAYYNPPYNEIVFPAGILQFPFFDANADDAINYGAIGAVIGHEMTHGFDDQGRQYDKEGNLKDWWTPEDAAKFTTKASQVASLYDSFTLLDNQHVNGKLTLGENLADIGGLNIAFDAFKKTKQGKESTKIDGFTPDQRFFLGFAQVWRVKNSDERMRMRLKVDPHSPEEFRINGPLYHMEAFYQAFHIPKTAKMYVAPEKRVAVW